MKAYRLTLILTALLGAAAESWGAEEKTAAVPNKAPAVAKLSGSLSYETRFKEVKERITALYQFRNRKPAPPDPRGNPFRTPGSVVMAARTGAAGEGGTKVPAGSEPVANDSAPGNNLALLQQGAATLRVSGTVELANRVHVVINKRPYKEGDMVATQVQGETVYLRVKEIARRSITLSIEDAEMILKF